MEQATRWRSWDPKSDHNRLEALNLAIALDAMEEGDHKLAQELLSNRLHAVWKADRIGWKKALAFQHKRVTHHDLSLLRLEKQALRFIAHDKTLNGSQ